MFDLELAMKNLPDKAGVYLMKDKNNEIIYIGKAKSLKNRVRQYFQSQSSLPAKVKIMVLCITHFEYIVTDTELEALVLECNLIKQHKPKYNVRLKDDKNYPYIKITTFEQFPQLLIVRNVEKDGAKYFGPYMSSFDAKRTIEILKKIFQIRSCKKIFPRDIARTRPCLNFHIKQCVAPCQGRVATQDYDRIIKNIITFLDGNYQKLQDDLTLEMNLAAQKFEYEKAAKIRDKIQSINNITEKQKIVSDSKGEKDLISIASDDNNCCAQVFFVRSGKLIGNEHFLLEGINNEENRDILANFIKQFYNGAPMVPKEIFVEYHIDEQEIIEKWLSSKRNSKVTIKVPQRGENKKMLQLVAENAKQQLYKYDLARAKSYRQLLELKELLSLPVMPRRIEAYDISNIGGAACVGSMVVFLDGKPFKKEYRKFKIKSIDTPNDYEAMREIIYRRFTHATTEAQQLVRGEIDKSKLKFENMPDLILLDGGKGHVSVIKSLLDGMEIALPVFGLVKDDKHRTRGIVTENEEVQLKVGSSLFHLLASIQKEVHRFAIAFHRKTRDKKNITSILTDIDGLGKIRINVLLTHFKSISKIKNAQIKEIEAVKGIDKKTAANIYIYFHK